MKWISLACCLLIFQGFGFGQNKEVNKNKGELEVEIGYNGRITPIYLVHHHISIGEPGNIVELNQQKHLTGTGLNATLRFNHNRWFAALGTSLRYDYTIVEYMDNSMNKESTFGKILMSDFHLDFGGNLYQKNNFSIAAFFGANLLNNGTSYSEVRKQVIGVNTITTRSFSDLSSFAVNTGLQVKKGNFSAGLNLYQAEEVLQFFVGDGLFLVPELRLRYTWFSKTF